MIYPYSLPENIESHAEKNIFKQLEVLKDKYDIFFSKSFIGRAKNEKKEYEIDFIITKKPDRRKNYHSIICMEVKGGTLEFNGKSNQWTQNGNILRKGPDKQATSASHSLIKRYPDLAKVVNVEWVLCFPDCEIPSDTVLPTNIDENRIIDRKSAIYIEEALQSLFDHLENSSSKEGCPYYVYEGFKRDLLRGVGFVETLSTQFKYEDKRFIELTNEQINTFNQISSNKKILISGYAGSGKTIIAIAAAQEKIDNGQNVLFLCYNRALANKIRYRFEKNEKKIKVATFHSLARTIIDKNDENWWKNNSNNDNEFWTINAPMKLDSVIDENSDVYDSIIIDEGQDFEELWFETIFRLASSDSSLIVFTDQRQNIFDRNNILPNQETFMRFELNKNCRNTKSITTELSKIIKEPIASHPLIPKGEEVTIRSFKTEKALVDALIADVSVLIKKHNINPEQILLMLNSKINESSIKNLWKIGNIEVTDINRSGRLGRGKIHYTSINSFKGLETDILFIIDNHLVKNKLTSYTQISRAKNKAYIFSLNN
jgi:hypothetical protein